MKQGLALREKRIKVEDLSVSTRGPPGYGTVCASSGAACGHWYYELHVDELSPESAFRVGWSTRRSRLDVPLGSDCFSFAIRSKGGEPVALGKRWSEFKTRIVEGDVIGCELVLPTTSTFDDDLTGFDVENPEFPGVYESSFMRFYLNDERIGPELKNLSRGEYFPAVSLYGRQKLRFDFDIEKFGAKSALQMHVDQRKPKKRPLTFIPRGLK